MDHLVNNFTSGEVSPKLGGRHDLGFHQNGVSWLENFFAMLQGGFTRRPGTLKVGDLPYRCRLIAFTISVELCFIIELSAGRLRIWQDGAVYTFEVEGASCDYIAVPYTESQLQEIQFTQDYQTLYLAHRKHAPKMLTFQGGSFTFGTLVPTTDSKYTGMFIGIGEYPGCVAYCSNRLWYGSSDNHPYRLWVSRPFDTHDFVTFETVITTTKVIKDPPWPAGWEDDQSLVYEDRQTSRDVTRADHAMVLEVGSSRNDRIEWLSVGRNLVVGTASSEWIIPGNIDALNQSIVPVSSYGSAPIQSVLANEDILFIQSGRKRYRGYVLSDGGYSCPDLTYTADHILSPGVCEMAFQRVPEPRVYYVLGDGVIAVLSYNKLYGLQAWSRWTFGGQVESLCVCDAVEGQRVFCAVMRDGVRTLERFDEGSAIHSDLHNTSGPIPFTSIMISNRYEMTTQDGTTFGKRKRISEVVLRLLASGRFQVGYNGLEESAGSVADGDYRKAIGGGYEKELRMQIRSVEDDPLTVLALSMTMEVG